MNKTRIDWCDMTWNPVTGCLHGCEYCYARGIVKRFEVQSDGYVSSPDSPCGGGHDRIIDLRTPMRGKDQRILPYPYGFSPTLHRYRFDEPGRKRKPQTIFVGSMTDLFGAWVPDSWIKAVFEAANRAPQHRYLYLTKNPDRYYQLGDGDGAIIPDGGVSGWFGASACTEDMAQAAYENANCTWMSLEPIHGEFSEEFYWCDTLVGDGIFDTVRRWGWIVVGAENGNRRDKVVPEREWIDNIVENCRATGTPVFMKESLRVLMGGDFKQEYPWEVST